MFVISYICRCKQQRKAEHNDHKKYALERGNGPAPCDKLDREGGVGRKEDIEMETEQPQGTATKEVDDYYFQDPTTIGKHMILSWGNP